MPEFKAMIRCVLTLFSPDGSNLHTSFFPVSLAPFFGALCCTRCCLHNTQPPTMLFGFSRRGCLILQVYLLGKLLDSGAADLADRRHSSNLY